MKILVNNNDEFKKLRKGLSDYKGLAGPRELKAKMLKILGIDPAEKPAKGPKKEAGKSRYGRLLSSAVGVIDELLFKGTTEEDILKTLTEKFPGKDVKQLTARLHGHMKQLKKEGITITEKNGKIKSKEEKHPNME